MQEVGDLREALAREVDGLKGEFSDLKSAIKQQIDILGAASAAATACTSSGAVVGSPGMAGTAKLPATPGMY
jgi:hypothetical protein